MCAYIMGGMCVRLLDWFGLQWYAFNTYTHALHSMGKTYKAHAEAFHEAIAVQIQSSVCALASSIGAFVV